MIKATARLLSMAIATIMTHFDQGEIADIDVMGPYTPRKDNVTKPVKPIKPEDPQAKQKRKEYQEKNKDALDKRAKFVRDKRKSLGLDKKD